MIGEGMCILSDHDGKEIGWLYRVDRWTAGRGQKAMITSEKTWHQWY